MDVTSVRKGLVAGVLDNLTVPAPHGLMGYWYVPGGVTVPCFFVRPESIKYDLTMDRGTDEMTFTLVLFVSRADDKTSQTLLDLFVSGDGPASFKAALVAARGADGELALGGACDDVHVTGGRAYQWFEHGSEKYLGAELTVRVIGDGAT